ncbi:kinase-like domain-containing protein [Podospora appendiculata]|uniref:non-specific serine/threonine protein kinase n=1 Tax=Podospora appendiculata TaxID=314037 RepID=A0AAE1C870_9PEZI|nr:kinase-like domain-containing protein [Podospora appendiculata]
MENAKNEYTLFKPLPDGLALVKRIIDGETFIAEPFESPVPEEAELRARGAAEAAANILNHENLVSLNTEIINIPVAWKNRPEDEYWPSHIILWDYCDAGTLENLLENPPVPRSPTGFLPESLVWHVALGMLRALQWLHEGIRDVYGVEAETGPARKNFYCCRRVRGTTPPEKDWMPVLHRNIKPGNIYLQHPKGIEMYGAVKLGDYGSCIVTGKVRENRRTPLVAMMVENSAFQYPGWDPMANEVEAPLEVLRENLFAWKENPNSRDIVDRPYTAGSELYALGEILYRMMRGRKLPHAERCILCGCDHIYRNETKKDHVPCPHSCFAAVNVDEELGDKLADYSAGLRALVRHLLRVNRLELVSASGILDMHWKGYESWTRNTPDGRTYRDIFNDIWVRRMNYSRKMGLRPSQALRLFTPGENPETVFKDAVEAAKRDADAGVVVV